MRAGNKPTHLKSILKLSSFKKTRKTGNYLTLKAHFGLLCTFLTSLIQAFLVFFIEY